MPIFSKSCARCWAGSNRQGGAQRSGRLVVFKKSAQWPTFIDPAIVAVAFLFSSAVGVFFGFYPAKKAASLDPIDALRYE